MEYVRALVFVLSLLVCCIVFSALATMVAIANPLILMLLLTGGLLGMFFCLGFPRLPVQLALLNLQFLSQKCRCRDRCERH